MKRAAILVVSFACSPDVARFAEIQGLTVTSIAPLAVARGTGCATLAGHGLNKIAAAQVAGQPARSWRIVSDEQAEVCPAAAVAVGAAGIALSADGVSTFLSQQISIVDATLGATLATAKAKPGDQLNINGSGFDTVNPTNNQVSIGASPAPVLSAFAGSLVVQVPAGAPSGAVTVSLASVDPPAAPVTSDTLIVIQPFTITNVVSADPVGLYSGTVAEVDLSAMASEVSVQAPSVTVDNQPATIVPGPTPARDQSHALFVALPEGLAPADKTPHQICIKGDLAAPCAPLAVLGPGHSELQRTPLCTIAGPAEASGPLHWSPDETNADGNFFEEKTVLLDDASDRVYIFDGSGNYGGTYALPAGHYQDFVTHGGCPDAAGNNCNVPTAQGYVAAVNQDDSTVVIAPFLSGSTVIFPSPGPVDALAPLTATTLGLFYHSAASTNTSVCMLDLVNGLCKQSTALGAPLAALTPTTDPNQGSRDRSLYLAILSGAPPAWDFIDFTTSPPTAAAPISDANIVLGNTRSLRWLATDDSTPFSFGFAIYAPTDVDVNPDVGGENILITQFFSFTGYGVYGRLELAPEYRTHLTISSRQLHMSAPVVSSYDPDNLGHWVGVWSEEPASTTGGAFFAFLPTTFGAWIQSTPLISVPMPSNGVYASSDGFFPNCAASGGSCATGNDCNTTACRGYSLADVPSARDWLAVGLPENENPDFPNRRMGALSGDNGLFVRESYVASTLSESLANSLSESAGTGSALASDLSGLRLWNGKGLLATLEPVYGSALSSVPLSAGAPRLSRRPNHLGIRVTQDNAFRSDRLVAKLLDGSGSPLSNFVSGASRFTALDADGQEQIVAVPGSTPLSIRLTPLSGNSEGAASEQTLAPVNNACVGPGQTVPTPATPATIAALGEGATFAIGGQCFEQRQPVQPCAFDDPVDTAFENPFDPRNANAASCPFHSFECNDSGFGGQVCRKTADIELWLAQPGGTTLPLATDLCGEEAQAVQLLEAPVASQRLLVWQVTQPFLFSECPPAFPTHVLASLLDVSSSPAQNLTESVLGPMAIELAPTGSAASALIRDTRWARWLYARPNGAGSDIVALSDALELTSVASLAAPVKQIEMSADSTRIYALSGDGLGISIFDNAETPVFAHSAALSLSAQSLLMAGDGSALVAAVADGYCLLSD